ncbi:zonadhesin-like [Aethina tumida]|uniref:zonadhesin-like n=1 Tax=Aethina tumida TaxID=116153 RepID=UPI002148B17D|nr:zonadhesin-like [Aethina tumida]
MKFAAFIVLIAAPGFLCSVSNSRDIFASVTVQEQPSILPGVFPIVPETKPAVVDPCETIVPETKPVPIEDVVVPETKPIHVLPIEVIEAPEEKPSVTPELRPLPAVDVANPVTVYSDRVCVNANYVKGLLAQIIAQNENNKITH